MILQQVQFGAETKILMVQYHPLTINCFVDLHLINQSEACSPLPNAPRYHWPRTGWCFMTQSRRTSTVPRTTQPLSSSPTCPWPSTSSLQLHPSLQSDTPTPAMRCVDGYTTALHCLTHRLLSCFS